MEGFDPGSFVADQILELKKAIGDTRALVAVSGGVDSTTCAVLTHKAIGENLSCVILDDAFMREGEPEYVSEVLSEPPLNVPMRIVDVREHFLKATKGLTDAEEKRKRFRETFYQALGEIAKNEGCRVLVQGTIRADIEETVGGIKTQHNVLEQMGINPMERFGFKVAEPLATLYKEKVRMVARFLGLPKEFSERQPFPGPGLSVRVVGEILTNKLDTLKKTTTIVEQELEQHNPSQYFAVIIDDEEESQQSRVVHIQELAARFLNVPSRHVHAKMFRDKATGVKGGQRCYGGIVGVKVQTVNGRIHHVPLQNLVSLQARIITRNPSIARVFYTVREVDEEKPYVLGVRAVQTRNFLTAEVSNIPWTTLDRAADKIIEECPNLSAVYYDVTPKPPATIEME